MPSIYSPDPTNGGKPLDTDYNIMAAAELRSLKSYLQTQLAALAGGSVNNALTNRNKVINGDFSVWQLDTNQTASGYGSDDMWLNEHNGSTKTHSRQAFTLGQTDVPDEPIYFSRTVVTSAANNANYVRKTQRIESVRSFAGRSATISFYAKADAAKNIAVELVQNFGTGGSPSATVNAIEVTTVPLLSSWRKITISVDVPSINGKTLGTDGNDYLEIVFWFEAGSDYNSRTLSLGQQSGTFDIALVQMELGNYATKFEFRDEFERCARYLYVIAGDASANGFASVGSGVVQSGGATVTVNIQLPAVMRATPAISFTGTISITSGVGVVNISTILTIYKLNGNSLWAVIGAATLGLTGGDGCIVYTQNNTSSKLILSARL